MADVQKTPPTVWDICAYSDRDIDIIATTSGRRIATLAPDAGLDTARLIVYAPELLQACELAVAALGPVDAAAYIQRIIDSAKGVKDESNQSDVKKSLST